MGQSTLSQEETRLLSRAEKLLSLANSSNEFEAQSAMQKVHEMYQKHNLENLKLKIQKIIRLNKSLPRDNSSVIVKYIPKGFNGDRISLYKDIYGSLNFEIIASEKTFSRC